MVPSVTPKLAVWEEFLRAHRRVVRRLDEDLKAAHGLALEWYDVLVQLDGAGGELKMGDLADAVVITAPNCTRLVDRMESAGLVERIVPTDDRRARVARLTGEGRTVLRVAAPTHLAGIERHFGALLPASMVDGLAQFFADVSASVAEH